MVQEGNISSYKKMHGLSMNMSAQKLIKPGILTQPNQRSRSADFPVETEAFHDI